MNDNTESNANKNKSQDGPSSTNTDHWNPKRFRMEVRDQAVAASFVEHDECMTVELLTTLCRALVTTNQEIWERCKPFYCTMINSAGSPAVKCTFYRVGFWNIRAKTKRQYHPESVKFQSVVELTKRSFEIPISLPERLECLVVLPQTKGNDIMPDYALILKRSMLLIDDILVGFLLEFKAFLENQQIALGKVEAWLVQADEDVIFLQNQFNVTIPCGGATWQTLGSPFASWAACKQQLSKTRCSRCGSNFEVHNRKQENGWVYCQQDQQPGCFPLTSSLTLSLKYECPGTIDVKFCIESPNERSRLIKFLEFAKHNAAGKENVTTSTSTGS